MSVDLHIESLQVSYGDAPVLSDFSLSVKAGEFVTLLGPSGSGKTTILNVVAGFIKQDAGRVYLGDEQIDHLSAEARGIGVLFQNYALFPHMTVGENVEFPLKVRKVGRTERRQQVEEILEMVGLAEFIDRPVSRLSGGQRQRVALARALVFRPKLLLLDEPLAALDKGLREAMQLELKRIQVEVGVATVCVTHDQNEALSMSDHVAVLSDGALEQNGTPAEVYREPTTSFVAGFLGDANLFSVADDGRILELEGKQPDSPNAMIRPENVVLDDVQPDGPSQSFTGIVRQQVFNGPFSKVLLSPEKNPEYVMTAVRSNSSRDVREYRAGDTVRGWIPIGAVHRVR